MESDLLEISGDDDDSLLLQHQQPLNDGVSSLNHSFFSCSPLHFPRSNPTEKAKNPSLLSNVNKENINNYNHNDVENRSELPKLSMEPQQMKRKKKGVGYNLRKSLAWNRAFFTEEGVLDSTELSLLSGNLGQLRGEKLSVIDEESEESSSGDYPDLQAIENNLFKELPLNNSDKNEKKKIGRSLLQKGSSSVPRNVVKQNALSVHEVHRSGSKRSGCPRPVVSTAPKRPANVSTTKAAVKETKVTKIPTTKPNSSVISMASKSAPNINKPRRNQSAQAAASAHRSTGLTGASRSSKSTQNDAKSSLASKSHITKISAQQAERNEGSSALASLQHPLVTKADNGSKINQDPLMAAGRGSVNHEATTSKTASRPQSRGHVSGNTQYAQPQMAKPSGLRMPSPSLGFFAQSKSSRNLQSSRQPCNIPKPKISNFQKIGALNSICEKPNISMKEDGVANDVAAITHAMPSTLCSVPSSANSLSKNIEASSIASKIPKVELKVASNSNCHELMNNKPQLHTNNYDLQEQIENVGLQCSDNRLHMQSQSSKQVGLDCKQRTTNLVIPKSLEDPHFNSHHSLQIGALKADDAGNQLFINEQQNSLLDDCGLFSQLHSGDVTDSNLCGSPKANIDHISIHDGHKQSIKQAEQAKPCTFDDDQIMNEIEKPHVNESTLLKEREPPQGFLSFDNVQSKDTSPEVRGGSAGELEKANSLSQCRGKIQGKTGAAGADGLSLQSHVADENMHALEDNLSLESNNALSNASEADNQHAFVTDADNKLVEQPSHTDYIIKALLTESNLQRVKLVASEVADASQMEMENTSSPCGRPPALQNGVHQIAMVVEHLYVENEASVSTDKECNHDTKLPCEATAPKRLECVREDQVTGAITACDIGVSNDCQSIGDLNGIEMDNSHSMSPCSQEVRLKGKSEVVESSSVLLNASPEDNQQTLVNDANDKLVEQPPLTDCLLKEANFSSESLLTESNLPSVNEVESEVADACQREMENSSALCGIPPALQNSVHEIDMVVDNLDVENEASVSTDKQCNHDIKIPCEATTSNRLECSREDQVTGAITACDIGVSNDCQNVADHNDVEMDNSHSMSNCSQEVPLKCKPEGVDIIDITCVEGNQRDLSAESNSSIPEPAEEINSVHVDSSGVLTNSSVEEQIDCESFAQAELIQSESNNVSLENQISDAIQGVLFLEGKCFNESQNSEGDNCASIGFADKSPVRGAGEDPFDVSQFEQKNEPNDNFTAGVNETSAGIFGEDTHLQSFKDGNSYDGRKPNIFFSAENNNFTVVEDLKRSPEHQSVVIVEPVMSDKFGLHVCEEVSVCDKITLSDDNHDCCDHMIRPENEQSGLITSLTFESSSLGGDELLAAGNTSFSGGNVLHEEVNRLENDVAQEFNTYMNPVEAKGTTSSVDKIVNNTKEVASLVVKCPLNAVPFSDEWLAAYEAAGEEILTMKSGAVQNSPQDKSLPEPGPWSPVRRHNQEIGPFDCTKFTNANMPPASDH